MDFSRRAFRLMGSIASVLSRFECMRLLKLTVRPETSDSDYDRRIPLEVTLMLRRLFPVLILLLANSAGINPARAEDPLPSTPPANASTPADSPAPPAPAAAPAGNVSLDDIRLFTAVLSLVKQAYVEPVDDHQLMQAAISGMLVGLDPHSEYLQSDALTDLTEDTSGRYAGLGIEVTTVDGTLRVISPIDDTPAARAGIQSGDIILRIDQVPVQADNLAGAVDMLRGKPGSKVSLTIQREGADAPREFSITREMIRVASVRARLLEPGYAYLRISQFQAETGSELRRGIARLQKENGKPLQGAVLDLRRNPGGLLTTAVEVSDLLLDAGTIVTTRGRIREADMAFKATPGDALDGAPLVVLIDNGSASAAEIVAGALKDNHRALIMGRRSFGKGSVQTVLNLDNEHAIKLTTARYYTPSGVSIQAAGIQPDIELADLSLSQNEGSGLERISERDLANHLQGDAEVPRAAAAPAGSITPSDYALSEALNALKAMALQRRPAPAENPGSQKG